MIITAIESSLWLSSLSRVVERKNCPKIEGGGGGDCIITMMISKCNVIRVGFLLVVVAAWCHPLTCSQHASV